MKIAFVHQPWNRIEHGAPQGSVPIWTSEVSRRLAGAHDVYVYSRRLPGLAATELVDGLRYIRVEDPVDPWVARYVEPLTRVGRRARSPFASPLFYPQYYRRIARDMAARGIDIVHIHSFPQAASIVRREHPAARIVVHLHVEWLNILPPRIARHQVRDADMVLGCSEYLAARMRAALPEHASRIRAVYNGVDTAHFAPGADGTAAGAPGRTLLYVGRISPEKGVHVLLEAFERAAAEVPDLRLDIVGHDAPAPAHVFEHLAEPAVVASLRPFYDTSAWARLRTWLRGRYPRRLRMLRDTSYGTRVRAMVPAHLRDRVRFLGFVANHELPPHYRRARVACLPSLTETFGMPLVEAMACGVPTIASDAGGIPEIVEEGRTGLLVPVFDAAALARAICTLAGDRPARGDMSARARQRVLSRFSWEAVVESLLEAYREARHGSSASSAEGLPPAARAAPHQSSALLS